MKMHARPIVLPGHDCQVHCSVRACQGQCYYRKFLGVADIVIWPFQCVLVQNIARCQIADAHVFPVYPQMGKFHYEVCHMCITCVRHIHVWCFGVVHM